MSTRDFIPAGYERLLHYIQDRHAVYTRRTVGMPKPWTKDPILRRYKFCNVYRELDKVTVWIREHIREPYAEHPHLWFMLCIARQINWPDTLQDLIARSKGVACWPRKGKRSDAWSADALESVLYWRQSLHQQVYGGAYMLTCNWGPGYAGKRGKPTWTAQRALGPLWEESRHIDPRLHDTLQGAAEYLMPFPAWGGFTAAQVVADLKYTRYLRGAADWHEWAASGPGSRRGMNRVLRIHHNSSWSEYDWLQHVLRLRAWLNPRWGGQPLCAQDVQNNLCEFDKYERARLGEGRPKTRYPGG